MDVQSLPAVGADGVIHIVVECPRGASVKLKYVPALKAFTLSRCLPTGIVYPHDWGFVPGTAAADGDPLDAIVVWDGTSYPGVVLGCRLLGVLEVEQNNKKDRRKRERNDRLIAVPIDAPRQADLRSIDDLAERVRKEIEAFFEASAAFEDKDLAFLGWQDPVTAYDLVRTSL